ncbi:Berberine bridge enzyme-like 8 [Vitis vinifera]|uniref:Berberine bridge enzyme-like 8 n=1 Tax=Vitis vinifera TaxID=29760 RepID=A0A438IUX4_VITVI|nr:Berberine bridge enzyme-like 8 [Vitis vinifera]
MRTASSASVWACVPPWFSVLSSSSSSCEASDSVYDTFIQCLASHSDPSPPASSIVYNQSNSSYTTVLQSYIRNRRFNTSSTPKPLIIVTPLVESHVQAAILCSKNVGMEMKIRSGGHDYDGLSYISDIPFFILDLFNLRAIDVNIGDETAWVQAVPLLESFIIEFGRRANYMDFQLGLAKLWVLEAT